MYSVARQLSDEEIVAAIRSATAPYGCHINTQVDYRNQIEFTIILPDGKKLRFNPDGNSSKPDTAASLNVVLLETRRKITDLGYQLGPVDIHDVYYTRVFCYGVYIC